MYLFNSFSLNMLSAEAGTIRYEPIPAPSSEEMSAMQSGIGYNEMATILGVKVNREKIKLQSKDVAIVAKYSGVKLESGITKLPEGSEIKFTKVYVL